MEGSLIHETDPTSPDYKRIKDVPAAETIAGVEEYGGRKQARELEARLASGETTLALEALTPQERVNLGVMEALPGIFQDAFALDTDGTPIRIGPNGEQYLVTAALDRGQVRRTAVITRRGFALLSVAYESGRDQLYTSLPEVMLSNHDEPINEIVDDLLEIKEQRKSLPTAAERFLWRPHKGSKIPDHFLRPDNQSGNILLIAEVYPDIIARANALNDFLKEVDTKNKSVKESKRSADSIPPAQLFGHNV